MGGADICVFDPRACQGTSIEWWVIPVVIVSTLAVLAIAFWAMNRWLK